MAYLELVDSPLVFKSRLPSEEEPVAEAVAENEETDEEEVDEPEAETEAEEPEAVTASTKVTVAKIKANGGGRDVEVPNPNRRPMSTLVASASVSTAGGNYESGQVLTSMLDVAKVFEQVSAGRKHLRALSQQLVEVQEAERRTLALELHDELGQMLNSIKMSLDMIPELPPENAQEQLQRAQALASDLVVRVRFRCPDPPPVAATVYVGPPTNAPVGAVDV